MEGLGIGSPANPRTCPTPRKLGLLRLPCEVVFILANSVPDEEALWQPGLVFWHWSFLPSRQVGEPPASRRDGRPARQRDANRGLRRVARRFIRWA